MKKITAGETAPLIPKYKYIGVDVPPEVDDWRLFEWVDSYFDLAVYLQLFDSAKKVKTVTLPHGKYEILGLAKRLGFLRILEIGLHQPDFLKEIKDNTLIIKIIPNG